MVSAPIFLTLLAKKQLTHDVWELQYQSAGMSILPGQYLLCDTSGDPKHRRSYSVSWVEGNIIHFIIKRIPDGKGGSVAICDQEVGHEMQVWGPMGRFVLQENEYPKVFIGTGTGFAPLYFMLKSQVQSAKFKVQNGGLFFLFGVRELRDVFYLDQLQVWARDPVFNYEIYCSRETSPLTPLLKGEGNGTEAGWPAKHQLGRVTDHLLPETIADWNSTGETEFYICGSPAMVTEVRDILALHGISKEKVFFEQY